MSAQAEMLTNRHDILKEKGTIADSLLVDHLFENFMLYATANWNYGAAGAPGDLLGTSGSKTVACDNLAGAFTSLIKIADDKLKPNPGGRPYKNWFISRPELKCFDRKVTGNMGNPGAIGATNFNLGCHFSAHYFVKFGDKYYNPCLSTTYGREDGAVFMQTNLVMGSDNLRYAGTGKSIILLKQKQMAVPGFTSVFEIFSIFKDDIKKSLTPKDYDAAKRNPALRAAGLK